MGGSVKLTVKKNWASDITRGLQVGLLELATDVQRRAVILAPVDTGALANSGNVEPVIDGYKIQFGSARVPYARKRHFENKKNPQTIGYLAKAGESVVRGNTSKYFRSKV